MGIKKEARRKYDRPPRLSFTLWNTHTGLAPHDFCGLELRHHQYVFLFKYIVFLSFVYRFRLQMYGDSFNLQTKPEFFCLLGQNSARLHLNIRVWPEGFHIYASFRMANRTAVMAMWMKPLSPLRR